MSNHNNHLHNNHLDDLLSLAHIARSDPNRRSRTGIPEVILAEGKTHSHVLSIAADMLATEERVLISRVSPDLLAALRERFPACVEGSPSGTTVVIRHHDSHSREERKEEVDGGRVGILTAGTSDIPVAEEALMLCRELGCRVHTSYDVGVAGLHRLHAPLQRMLHDIQVDVLIVAAGMDGALPSVVAGLVDCPVIGLPTSVGYGMGGNGTAALLSMLQTCAPGLAVVNIDNGIGAGAMAARIANRMEILRQDNE
jgi:NCAIR mutase (PurE)-related protein